MSISVYPAKRPLFHGAINPRIARGASCTCYIMWSRCSSFDNEGVFQPNHFVTLSEVHIAKPRAKTYAQIVSGNKKGEGEKLGGKKPECLLIGNETQFLSPSSPGKSNEQGNSADDTEEVQEDPVMSTSSVGKGKKDGISTNERKVAVEDQESLKSSPGKGMGQGNSVDNKKLVGEDPVSSKTSLVRDKEEGITANEKKIVEEDPFSSKSSPGEGKEQGNTADDTKEVEDDSRVVSKFGCNGQSILQSSKTGVSI